MSRPQAHTELLPHLFREEYAKMTAVLCRHFGLKYTEIAEDIVSDTFLKASEHWAINGMPENPKAWLYTIAKNKTKDYFKHHAVFEKKVKEAIKLPEVQAEPDFEFNTQNITDSQLAMIFAVCNPANPEQSQIYLALQILCGFSTEEIADAFLTKKETVKKRLQRARNNLRNDNFQIKLLTVTAIKSRLNTVLRTLYLLFNEGYFSKSHDQLIRKDLCFEATRLAFILNDNKAISNPETNALLALMCYQSSRLNARTNLQGEIILFDEQDKTLWDHKLIEKGNYYLVNACHGNEISKYHLEAGIAYWHTTPTGDLKWPHILELYNQLLKMEYSAITALNRTFAVAQVFGYSKAIAEAEKLHLTDLGHYHQLLGYLYAGIDVEKAVVHYQHASRLAKSKSEKQILSKEIERLNSHSTTQEDFSNVDLQNPLVIIAS